LGKHAATGLGAKYADIASPAITFTDQSKIVQELQTLWLRQRGRHTEYILRHTS